MKEEWICQVLADIMAARVVPVEDEVPAAREEVQAGPEWAGPLWEAIGVAFVPWGTGPLPHLLPAAAPEGLPGGDAAAACFRSLP